MKKITWCEKYLLAMSESLTIKDIMQLRDVGQPKALLIRKEAIEYCLRNNIEVEGKRIPTIAVLNVTNLNLTYYYEKMINEAKAKEIMNKLGDLLYVGA